MRWSATTDSSKETVRSCRDAFREIQVLPHVIKLAAAEWRSKGEIEASPAPLFASMPLNIPNTARRVAITNRSVKTANPPITRRIRLTENDELEHLA